jgi:hypothetical protein
VQAVPQALFDFVTLLVFPLLGILTLLKKRASPLLLGVVLSWLVLGACALIRHWHAGLTRARFTHHWLVGLALGIGFLAVDRLRRRKQISNWLKLVITTITVLVFARALHDFLLRHG